MSYLGEKTLFPQNLLNLSQVTKTHHQQILTGLVVSDNA